MSSNFFRLLRVGLLLFGVGLGTLISIHALRKRKKSARFD